jgi:hypothetical protein
MVCTVLWSSLSIFEGIVKAIELPHGGGDYSHSLLLARDLGNSTEQSPLRHTRCSVLVPSCVTEYLYELN